jgi:4a-hydroxytetrahydrobiopterin dehydratase
MNRPRLLAKEEVETSLSKYNHWKLGLDGIRREVSFSAYLDGLDFVKKVALLSEKLNHHPQIVLDYKRVTIVSITHEPFGFTELDFQLANEIELILAV